MNNCKNCNSKVSGNFCYNCGQKTNTHRISHHEILHDTLHSVWHLDNGFLYTFIQIIKKPWQSILKYITGTRIHHFSPLSYLLLTSAITILTISTVENIVEKGTKNTRIELTKVELKNNVDTGKETKSVSFGTKIGRFVGTASQKYLGFLFMGELTINISDLSNGLYFVKINSKEFTQNQKLVIQR